jgi:pyruvate/2-oxoglutarate dehydrogenase complex dihydrolipoamide acyltransferase (E2) component
LLESDKASVEVPSPVSGTVESVAVKEGDSVKEGVVLLKVKTQAASEETTEQTATANENTVAQPAEPLQQMLKMKRIHRKRLAQVSRKLAYLIWVLIKPRYLKF